MVVNIRVPFEVLIIIRHLIFRAKRGHKFDTNPYIYIYVYVNMHTQPDSEAQETSLMTQAARTLRLQVAQSTYASIDFRVAKVPGPSLYPQIGVYGPK